MLRMEKWMDIKMLKQQGHSIRQIAELTGHSHHTIRKVLRGQARNLSTNLSENLCLTNLNLTLNNIIKNARFPVRG